MAGEPNRLTNILLEFWYLILKARSLRSSYIVLGVSASVKYRAGNADFLKQHVQQVQHIAFSERDQRRLVGNNQHQAIFRKFSSSASSSSGEKSTSGMLCCWHSAMKVKRSTPANSDAAPADKLSSWNIIRAAYNLMRLPNFSGDWSIRY